MVYLVLAGPNMLPMFIEFSSKEHAEKAIELVKNTLKLNPPHIYIISK